MTRAPSIPCTSCGQLLWAGSTCVPDDQRVCRKCRTDDRSGPEPAVGQVWGSLDARRPGQRIRVVDVARPSGRVLVESVAPANDGSMMHVGRRREVRLDLFGPVYRGYALVDGPDDVEPPDAR